MSSHIKTRLSCNSIMFPRSSGTAVVSGCMWFRTSTPLSCGYQLLQLSRCTIYLEPTNNKKSTAKNWCICLSSVFHFESCNSDSLVSVSAMAQSICKRITQLTQACLVLEHLETEDASTFHYDTLWMRTFSILHASFVWLYRLLVWCTYVEISNGFVHVNIWQHDILREDLTNNQKQCMLRCCAQYYGIAVLSGCMWSRSFMPSSCGCRLLHWRQNWNHWEMSQRP